jgi:H+/Cl- antiporter ClcA
MPRSRAGTASLIGLFLGVGFVAYMVVKTYESGSAQYWPLLVIGLVIGCVSAPFYYYFKARDRQPSNPYEITAITLAHQAQNGATKHENNRDN